ncbi:MAG: hypothetical protein Q9160_008130 [Pyrenula sp. 1 TL-2023]
MSPVVSESLEDFPLSDSDSSDYSDTSDESTSSNVTAKVSRIALETAETGPATSHLEGRHQPDAAIKQSLSCGVQQSRRSSPPPRIRFPGELVSTIPWHSLTGQLPDSGPPSPSTTQPPLPFTSPFRFFSFPAEIRNRIYTLALPTIQPLAPVRRRRQNNKSNPSQTLRRLALFLVSKCFHAEASHLFYTSQTFRIFPLQDNHPLPTLLHVPPRYRQQLTSLELLLGSDWQKPPASWKVMPSLGLNDLEALRTLRVFVSFDPSHPFYKNYRVSYDFYTDFCGDLLGRILDGIPKSLESVKLDAYPSVQLNGPLMSRLVREIMRRNLDVRWGPERGWGEAAWFDGEK